MAFEKKPDGTRKYPKQVTSYPNRLLKALTAILEDDNTSVAERLQAAQLALETLPHRTMPRRKSSKEKLVIAALEQSKTKKAEAKKPPPEKDSKS